MKTTTYMRPASGGIATRGQGLRNQLGFWLTVLLLVLASIIILAPIVWTFSTSLRQPADSFSVPPKWIPIPPDFSNYAAVFQTVPGGLYVLNSAIITFSTVIGQLITASLAGYAFARFEFPGKNILFWLILATLMIPGQATIIPVFVLISS